MRKLLLLGLALLVSASLALADSKPKTYYKTYSVSATPYTTNYMVFQPYHAGIQLENLLRVREQGDFDVVIDYQKGLQVGELQVSSMAGRPYLSIPFTTPIYQVSVYDKAREQVLDKTYGGQNMMVDFGKGLYTDEMQLQNAWNQQKRDFLQKLEFKNLKFDQLQLELSELVQRLESIAPAVVDKPAETAPIEVEDIFASDEAEDIFAEEDDFAEAPEKDIFEEEESTPLTGRVFGSNLSTADFEESETTQMEDEGIQEDPGLTNAGGASYKNLVKLNLPNLGFKNITLNYERVLSDRNSATLTLGYLLPNPFIGASTLSSTISNEEFSGFTATGEYRFYGKKKGAPRGFYYAPYARYANYQFDFSDTIEGNPADIASKLSTYGIGIQIGTQWIIKDRFVIDWGILGASIQQYNLNSTFTSTDLEVDFDEIRESLEMDIEDFNALGSTFEFTSGEDSLQAKLPFLFGGLRSYLTVGMQF